MTQRGTGPGSGGMTAVGTGTGTTITETPKLTRFHGTIRLDSTRLGRDAGRIAEEVVQHLAGLVDAEVEVTLEIHLPEDGPRFVP